MKQKNQIERLKSRIRELEQQNAILAQEARFQLAKANGLLIQNKELRGVVQ